MDMTKLKESDFLPVGDRMNSFEKILLMTGSIASQANQVREVLQNRIVLDEYNTKTGRDNSFSGSMVQDTLELLDETSKQLHVIYEQLVDFCNGCDAVSETDIAIGKPIFAAMNDLKPNKLK